jgi:hypothetical protein
MTEHSAQFVEFDPEAAGEALQAKRRATRDVAHGDGEAFAVSEGTELEVYPTAGVARVTTEQARLELYRVPTYSIDSEGGRLVLDMGDENRRTRLLVRRDGNVSFYPVLRALGAPTADETSQGRGQDTPSMTNAPEGSTAAENLHVQLTGRLGRDPWYRSDGETSTGGFPIAVNDDEGGTKWHKVVVFDAVADKLEQARETRQLRKGMLVQLTGQHVTREEPGADGQVRRTQEFHASGFARVRTTRPVPRRQV